MANLGSGPEQSEPPGMKKSSTWTTFLREVRRWWDARRCPTSRPHSISRCQDTCDSTSTKCWPHCPRTANQIKKQYVTANADISVRSTMAKQWSLQDTVNTGQIIGSHGFEVNPYVGQPGLIQHWGVDIYSMFHGMPWLYDASRRMRLQSTKSSKMRLHFLMATTCLRESCTQTVSPHAQMQTNVTVPHVRNHDLRGIDNGHHGMYFFIYT